jgi:hypothetical protein
MAAIKRMITGEKLGEKECRRIEKKEKEMIEDAFKLDKALADNLIKTAKSMPLLAEMGLYTADEAFEIYKHINAAIQIMGSKNADAVAKRVADLSIRRIAKKVGGEVVEETES